MTLQLTWMFLGISVVATLAATGSMNRVPVAVSIAVAAVFRIGFAALTSRAFTPRDVSVYFRNTAELILQGKDPLHDLPGRQWNFLELMPVVHAAELRSGLPWVYAVKIVPILADLTLVWMVAKFAVRDGRTRALQYACNPVSLLVVSLHGQVEPVALVLALGGVLLIRSGRPVLGGILLGAAVAAKTWPVVILLAVLPIRDIRPLVRIVAASAVVPVLCLGLGVIFLDTQPISDLRYLAGYSSFVADWTWSGVLVALNPRRFAGYSSPLSPIGSALILTGVAVTMVLLRKRPPEVRAFAVLCAALVGTAGFGPQYFMWTLPLMMALSGPVRSAYAVAAAGWAAVFYLSPFARQGSIPGSDLSYLQGMSWLPAGLLVAALLQQIIWRPESPDRPDSPKQVPESPNRSDSQEPVPDGATGAAETAGKSATAETDPAGRAPRAI